MSTKKQKTEAKINWGWDAPENRNGKATRSTKSSTKKAKSTAKKLGFSGLIIGLCVLLICAVLGATVCYFISTDDCFDIIGNDQLTLMAGETIIMEGDEEVTVNTYEPYIDEGCKVIEFGTDKSHKVTIETDLVINADGSFAPQKDNDGNYILKTYYIIYRAETFKYSTISNIKRIRLIDYVEYGVSSAETSN